MAAKKGDRVRHKETKVEGVVLSDPSGGSISVKQDDGTVAAWATDDAIVI